MGAYLALWECEAEEDHCQNEPMCKGLKHLYNVK